MRRHQLRSKVQHYFTVCFWFCMSCKCCGCCWCCCVDLSEQSPSSKTSIQSSKVRPLSKLKLLEAMKLIQGEDRTLGTSNQETPILGSSTLGNIFALGIVNLGTVRWWSVLWICAQSSLISLRSQILEISAPARPMLGPSNLGDLCQRLNRLCALCKWAVSCTYVHVHDDYIYCISATK